MEEDEDESGGESMEEGEIRKDTKNKKADQKSRMKGFSSRIERHTSDEDEDDSDEDDTDEDDYDSDVDMTDDEDEEELGLVKGFKPSAALVQKEKEPISEEEENDEQDLIDPETGLFLNEKLNVAPEPQPAKEPPMVNKDSSVENPNPELQIKKPIAMSAVLSNHGEQRIQKIMNPIHKPQDIPAIIHKKPQEVSKEIPIKESIATSQPLEKSIHPSHNSSNSSSHISAAPKETKLHQPYMSNNDKPFHPQAAAASRPRFDNSFLLNRLPHSQHASPRLPHPPHVADPRLQHLHAANHPRLPPPHGADHRLRHPYLGADLRHRHPHPPHVSNHPRVPQPSPPPHVSNHPRVPQPPPPHPGSYHGPNTANQSLISNIRPPVHHTNPYLPPVNSHPLNMSVNSKTDNNNSDQQPRHTPPAAAPRNGFNDNNIIRPIATTPAAVSNPVIERSGSAGSSVQDHSVESSTSSTESRAATTTPSDSTTLGSIFSALNSEESMEQPTSSAAAAPAAPPPANNGNNFGYGPPTTATAAATHPFQNYASSKVPPQLPPPESDLHRGLQAPVPRFASPWHHMPRFASWHHFGHMVPPHGAAPHHPGFGPPQPPPSNGNIHQPYVNGYVYPPQHHTASPGPHPHHANGHPGAPPPPIGHPGAPPPAGHPGAPPPRYLEPNYMNGSYGSYHHHQPHHQQRY